MYSLGHMGGFGCGESLDGCCLRMYSEWLDFWDSFNLQAHVYHIRRLNYSLTFRAADCIETHSWLSGVVHICTNTVLVAEHPSLCHA